MIEFDGLLVEYVNEISKAAAEFKESIRSLKFGEAKGYIEEVGDTLEALEEKFSERMESILEMKH